MCLLYTASLKVLLFYSPNGVATLKGFLRWVLRPGVQSRWADECAAFFLQTSTQNGSCDMSMCLWAVQAHRYALLCAFICVLLLCSPMCSHMCALLCVLSYVYVLICVLSYVCSHMSALICVLPCAAHVCALICLLSCAFIYLLLCALISVSSSLSQPLVSYPFAPAHCLGSLTGIIQFTQKHAFYMLAVFFVVCDVFRKVCVSWMCLKISWTLGSI